MSDDIIRTQDAGDDRVMLLTEHWPQFVYDNIGQGWRCECGGNTLDNIPCGWNSDLSQSVGDAGSQFDDHLRTIAAEALKEQS